MSYSGFYAIKSVICFLGFIASAVWFGGDSMLLFWVGTLATVASLLFFFLGE